MSRAAADDSLDLNEAVQATLIAGARDAEPVRGLTHGFYKYPARFSPVFVRSAIEAFTEPGDLVLTGTPWGCGEFMDPKRSLHDGDIVEAAVEGIGALRNRVREVHAT